MKPTGRPGRNKASPRSAAPKKSAAPGRTEKRLPCYRTPSAFAPVGGAAPGNPAARGSRALRGPAQHSGNRRAARQKRGSGQAIAVARARAPACADGRRPCLSGCPSAPSPSRSKRLCKLCSCLCSRGRRKCRTATLHRLLRLPASCVTCREPSFEQHSNPICKGERLCP